MNETNKLYGYHYTNNEAFKSMHDGSYYGKKDLIPVKRFITLGNGSRTLPWKAHEGVIEGLLEPEPKSWTENPEFPNFWGYLMHDICKRKEVILLRFELQPKDLAFVVDRAYVERELYRQGKGRGKPTKRSMSLACRRYWESRVRADKYEGGYSAPQLAIWTPIALDRLEVVWRKPVDEVWNRVLENGW